MKTEANPEPFLEKDPLEYLLAGDFQKVPWIVGKTQDEGILRVSRKFQIFRYISRI